MDGADSGASSAPDGASQQTEQSTAPQQAQNTAQSLGWRAGLPKEYQDHEAFRGFGKVGDLAKSHLELMTRNQRALYLPTDESSEDERKAFLKSIGHPETADAYKMPEVPKGIHVSQESIAEMQRQAHGLGWTTKQFEAYMTNNLSRMQQAQTAQAEAKAKALADSTKALHDEWGDKHDANAELALRAFKRYTDEETVKSLTESGLVNQPWFIKFMHKVGQATGEGGFIRGAATGGAGNPNHITQYKPL